MTSADINFLPDQDGKKSDKPPVRKIEYTRPEGGKPVASPTKRGGIFSVFRKHEEEEPDGEQKKEQVIAEPVVKQSEEKKYIPPKVTMIVEKKKPAPKKERKGFFDWLKSLFSRKEKPLASKTWEAYQGMAPTQPGYDPKNVEGKFDTHVMLPVPPKASPAVVLETLQPPKPPVPTPPPSLPIGSPAPVPKPPTPAHPPVPQEAQKNPAASLPEQKFTKAKVDMGPQSQGMSFDVNLVPEDLAERSKTFSRLSLLGLIIVISIAFVGLLYGGLEVYRENVTSKVRSLTDDVTALQQQTNQLKQIQLDALALKKRTDEVYKLLDAQIHWTAFFSKLEKYTLTNVTFTSLTADSNGAVTLVASAPSPDIAFEQVAVFKNAKDFADSVELQQLPTMNTQIVQPTTQAETAETGIPATTPTTSAPGATSTSVSTFTIQLTLNPALLTSNSSLAAGIQKTP